VLEPVITVLGRPVSCACKPSQLPISVAGCAGDNVGERCGLPWAKEISGGAAKINTEREIIARSGSLVLVLILVSRSGSLMERNRGLSSAPRSRATRRAPSNEIQNLMLIVTP
jgi:hypothetical protein